MVIQKLRDKSWDVEYGLMENIVDKDIDSYRVNEIQDDFAKDFMSCIDELGL